MNSTNQNQGATHKNITTELLDNNFFSFERFIKRLIKNWYLFLIAFIIGWAISFLVNRFSDRFYQSSITTSISTGTSSILAPSQSINFIWGGNSGATQGIFYKKLLTSRTHNENLVRSLNLYINYYTKGKIKKVPIDYVDIPFKIIIDTTYAQALGSNTKIKLLPNNKFELTFPEVLNENCFHYPTEKTISRKDKYNEKLTANLNDWVKTNNMKFKIVENSDYKGRMGTGDYIKDLEFYFYLTDINSSVSNIISTINIDFDTELSSIMIISKKGLSLDGTINFLNRSVDELKDKLLNDKNLVNLNTINFIKDQLIVTKKKLDSATVEFEKVQIENKVFYKSEGGGSIGVTLAQIQTLDFQKAELLSKKNAVEQLRSSVYSGNATVIDNSLAGITNPNFDVAIQNMQVLESEKREKLLLYRPNSEPIKELDFHIQNAKSKVSSILDSSVKDISVSINSLQKQINTLESDITNLPEKERLFVNAQRGYLLNDAIYNTLLTKLSEVEMRKATTISDLTILDKAKNIGQGPITPNTQRNKYMYIAICLAIPFILLFIIELLDNKLKILSDLKNTTKIPLLGIIGNKNADNNLAVLSRSKSTVSENFRSIRSNLRFLFNERSITGGKVLLITSSIGGEGKTFVAINMASVYAVTGKKTVLVGMDLRKPRIFDDFKISNKIGLSSYLSGTNTLEEIIKPSGYENFDIIPAGPIPPNPGELLISNENEELIKKLREIYDYIIIDSPPVGLVTDAFDLINYSDARIYVARANYTYKQLLKGINERFKREEIHNIGIVFNDYTSTDRYGYGYGYGYGYFEEDEEYDNSLITRIKRLFYR